jgi:hypothetical protein
MRHIVFVFSMWLLPVYLFAADCPNINYSELPLGQDINTALAQARAAKCTVNELSPDEYQQKEVRPPYGLLHTQLRKDFREGVYLQMNLYALLHSEAMRVVNVECTCWKQVESAYLFFTASRDRKLFMVEKSIKGSGAAKSRFKELKGVLDESLAVVVGQAIGRYDPIPLSRTDEKAYLATWEDKKRLVKSFLVVTENLFGVTSETFVGHVWMPGWDDYVRT